MINLSKFNSYNTNGYITYYIPQHHLADMSGKVYEHMIMAEELLGRKLIDGEVVHHKDENRLNNSLDNLMVFKSRADHSAYHKGCDIKLDGDVYIAIHNYEGTKHNPKNTCLFCGDLKDVKADMCLTCYKKEQAKNIPSKEKLCGLICNYSMCKIGDMFGVSGNAVRKWCRKYDLPFKKKDIEEFKKSTIVNMPR